MNGPYNYSTLLLHTYVYKLYVNYIYSTITPNITLGSKGLQGTKAEGQRDKDPLVNYVKNELSSTPIVAFYRFTVTFYG